MYLDSGTIWGSGCWARVTPSFLEKASSPFSVTFLFALEEGWLDGIVRGLWGNCTPALCKNN